MPLHGIDVSRDSKRVAVTAHDGVIHVWNLETGDLERSLGESRAEKIDPSKYGSLDDIRKVWKAITEVRKLPLHSIVLPAATLSPDGKSLGAAERTPRRV